MWTMVVIPPPNEVGGGGGGGGAYWIHLVVGGGGGDGGGGGGSCWKYRSCVWLFGYSTVKPVCNDHLYNKIYYLWFIQ